MEKLVIKTFTTKPLEITGFDNDNELEIDVFGECIWLQKDQVKQVIQFLQTEVERLESKE
jgi:hypothetical protein